ncbi:MAG: Ig-like domain repeat protein [Methanobrevibacter sp.]|nr:Ig-like domain repeat protein [Methanobrevibacter sp.]
MKKKTIGILLMISLVMIMGIAAISAADTNDTLLEEVSDTNIALAEEIGDTNIAETSSALEQDANDTSQASESASGIEEINVDDSRDEIHKVEKASSASDDVLSASDDDLLKHSSNNFLYGGEWYYDLEDAWSAAESNGGGTIEVWTGYYKYTDDDDDFEYKVNTAVSITLQPRSEGAGMGPVTFDGGESGWFLRVTNKNVKVTINDITFRNMKAKDGGAIEVEDGAQLTLNRCIFENNYASSDGVSYGLGGAIDVDEGTLVANNCRFINNKADRYGGAICIEDKGSVTLNNCYFEGNKKGSDTPNDFDGYDEDEDDAISWSFYNCLFKSGGSIEIEVDAPNKAVSITPDVSDDVNYAVLYKDDSEYARLPCNDGDTVTFGNTLETLLEPGTYTVYMMKNYEKRYIYSGATFTIIEPNFILNDKDVFETLSAAVNAISNGGSGVITVVDGTYSGSSNLNVQINNKIVTIRPKDSDEEPVIFSGDSQSNFLIIGSGSKLTMEDITITGRFSDSALKFNGGSEGEISDCEFKNIQNNQNQPGNPIKAQNSNLVLNGNTFESNSKIILENTVANIDDCSFTSNSGNDGGAIYADSSTDLTVTNSEFNLNEATNKGGAIYATNLKLHNNEFIGNSANLGGAIYLISQSNSLVNITNCVFDLNHATNYRNIYSESLTRKFNLEFNEYDLDLQISLKDSSYGSDYILDGVFDWGSNLNNTYIILTGIADDENIFGDMLTVVDNKFKINLGVIPGGTHEFAMPGMYEQGDSNDHFHGGDYYNDLYGNEFYLKETAYAKIGIEKANITLNLNVDDVLIPEIPVLNVYANFDHNYTVFIQNKYYQVEVVNGKGSIQLTGLDLGNYTVVAMRDADENFNLAMNFTTFSISKTYSNFLVLSTNVEYDTLAEAVANSNNEDEIYVKKGTYADTGIVISNKTLDIIALEGAVFDARGGDANFIIVNENAEVYIYGIKFTGLHNRNTNYGAIVNHGDLALESCNFTDNKITKTSFAKNGGTAIFNDGHSLEIDSCNFINNAAPLKVSTAAVTSLGYEDVSIVSSKFVNNSAREGGALHFKNITQFAPAIVSCDFEQNTAVKGSAIYVGSNSRYLSVSLSSFKKNDIKNSLGENAQLEGGVIYVNANTTEVVLDIGSSNFENNSNSKVDGGVIYLDGSSKASIESCIFNNNLGKVGSVILIKNPYNKKLSLMIDSSNFINNHATTGAIATSPKITTFIDECLFTNNTGENRHIHSNGFTVVHDSILDVKNSNLNAMSVQYGENSNITGIVDIGTNLYAAANLTVAGENVIVEIKNNTFNYKAGILPHGKYYAVLNKIADNNNNTYLMDSITGIFRVNNVGFDLDVSVDNITYGESIKVVEKLPANAMGTVKYQLNGKIYTKEELEALKLDAGNYTLVALYDHEDYMLTSSIINFEVYKANPTISVADVEVGYNDTIIVNIETNVPSIYTIEIGDYKTDKYVNGSRSVEIENTFEPGTYTIKVTSQERVNYISNFTEATLKVNKNLATFALSVSRAANPNDAIIEVSAPENAVGNIKYTVTDSKNKVVYTATQSCRDDLVISDLNDGTYDVNAVFEGDDRYYSTNNIKTSLSIKKSLNNANNEIRSSPEDNNLGEEDEGGRFIYQYDEDDDFTYFDTLEDAVDEAVLYGAGIITVRGGTYSVSSMDIEGEIELTIRGYENEEVIFDCGGENYFMLLTYDEEMEWVQVPPPPHPEFEQTDGPTVTLENITVINGVATYGGAIDLEAGTLTLMNCNFHNNNADEGGAIYIGKYDAENDAMLIAVNTTFTNNYASSEGGAIYITSGNLDGQSTSASFYLCTFLDNYQGEDDERKMNYFAGGNVDEIDRQYCVFNGDGQIFDFAIDKINQTVYVNGTSVDPFDSVVLLYFDQVPLYTINNNGSRDFNVIFEDVMGGNYTVGVMNDHDFNTYIFDVTFEMRVPNFILSKDEVYENLTDAIDAVAENGIIYANVNYYDEDNMEIDIRKSFTLKNFRDDGVVFDGSGQKWFFTIARGCTVVFDGISFTDGGMKTYATIENNGDLIITNCSFESFETGVIIYNSGLLNILNSTFSLNFIDNALVLNDKDLVIDSVEFSSNIVNISSVVYNNGDANILSSNFTENYNGGNGGVIYNKKALLINNTVFTENEGYNGGVVYNEGTLDVINSTFEDNTANGYGGAIYNENELHIFNSTFTGGSSEIDGGALYNNNIMTVDNSTLVGNTATGRGGAIYNNKSLELTKSIFGINFADEYANIYNAGDIQFSENMFDFYDVILIIPDGQYGIPTTITGTLDPQFNMDLQVTLPGFVNYKDATVTISEGVFEYVTDVLPKGIYDVILNEIIYDSYGNIYYGEAIVDRLIIHKANVYINLTVDDIILRNSVQGVPVLKISASKDGLLRILFNNKFTEVTVTGGQATLTLATVEEGNYSVFAVREGDENYNDAFNTTTFTVSEYEGNFVVNSTGGKFDTLREAIENSAAEDIIYANEGNYSGTDNLGLTISGKKLTIISIGDVVFDANSSDLSFLTINENSDVTLCDVVITGFNDKEIKAIINNTGNLTVDGCTFVNNNITKFEENAIIYSKGNLSVVESEFYDNILTNGRIIYIDHDSNFIVNESSFENNKVNGDIIYIDVANSVKIISSVFTENIVNCSIINVMDSTDVLISSMFYNNTVEDSPLICANENTNLLVNNSIFAGNTASDIILTGNTQSTISGCIFTENTAEYIVFSQDDNISVIESTFSDNTITTEGALYIGAMTKIATVNGCIFSNNNAYKHRNIVSYANDLNVSNSVFDVLNVEYTVHDIDYGQIETIEGTIDIGSNFKFTAYLDINSNSYPVNVTDGKFTYNSGILNGGDYNAVLSAYDKNSNHFVFNKITKIFTVNRVDPGLNISIDDITQGEKLIVNSKINKSATAKVVYELNGKMYSKNQLENLTLNHGNYLVTAIYRGDKNFLPATEMVNAKVNKVTPNITVSDVVVNYGDEIKVNVTADIADSYTVFLDNRYNESISLNVDGSAIFTFPSEGFKPDIYSIIVYKIETDNYAEAVAYANLTVNKAKGLFNLSNVLITYGENATVDVSVPVNAYGNITYKVYDGDMNLVYNITQSCLEELVVPNLTVGTYIVTGTFEGDSYYTNESKIKTSIILVNTKAVNLNVTVSNITYEENATVNVEADVDGEYLVYVGNESIVVTVVNGTGNVSVPNLTVGYYDVNVTVVDGNYSGLNETAFNVSPKQIQAIISIGNITYGDDAIVVVEADVDGEYIVEVNNQNYTVNVVDGKGNTTISGLFVDEDILASVSIVDGNYSTYNTTTFNVTPKQIPVNITVATIVYGENAVVVVQADVDGDYIVNIRDVNYTVSVNGGDGVIFVPNLEAGEGILVSVSIVDGNYSAYNTTTFSVLPKEVSAIVSVGNITYGEDVVVVVEADVDGDYIVNIRDVNYTVSVNGGNGVIFVPNLGAGNQIVVTVRRDDNHTAFNETTFNINPKMTNVEVAVEDITWNESAVINIVAEIDGMYNLSVNDVEYLVEVIDGNASQVIPGLAADDYVVKISIVNSNYSAVNKTEFSVAPMPVSFALSVENISYGEEAIIIVEADVDGEYLVYVDDEPMMVTVVNGTGNLSVSNLTVGSYDVDVNVIDGNHSGFDYTSFDVVAKQTNVSVSVGDVAYGEDAVVSVVSDVDGEYLVYVGNESMVVTVVNGTGNVSVSNLTVGSYDVNVTVVDGNYSGFDYTSFDVVAKQADVSVSVGDVAYGEDAVVSVVSDVDGEYLVYVGNESMVVTVVNGTGNVSVSNLTVGSYDVIVTVVDGNYSGFDYTSFDVKVKQADVSVSVEDIDYGEDAVVSVVSDVDGEYLVYVDHIPYTVDVADGTGSITVSNLTVGSHDVIVTVADGNYSGFNSTSFDVTFTRQATEVSVNVSNIKGGAIVDISINPNATGNVTIKVDGKEVASVPVENGAASVILENLTPGVCLIETYYPGDDNYGPVSDAKAIMVENETQPENITVIVDGVKYIIVYENGTATVTTNKTPGPETIIIDGVEYTIVYVNGTATVTTKTEPVVIQSTYIIANDFSQYACDFYEGERGENFTFKLIDEKGNPLANKTIYIGYNGVTLNRTTDAKGYASVQINLKNAGLYTFVIVFLGDGGYDASMAVHKVTIKKKTTSIAASAKTFKATAKTKKYTVTLKTIKGASIDGKTYLASGKKVTLKLNGKTYTAKTNAKGKATFSLKITKKGKFTATIKYAGDVTYKASSKKVKLTFK